MFMKCLMRCFLYINVFAILLVTACTEKEETLHFLMKHTFDDCKTCNLENRADAQASIKSFRDGTQEWTVDVSKNKDKISICNKEINVCDIEDFPLTKGSKEGEYFFTKEKNDEVLEFEGMKCVFGKTVSSYYLYFDKETVFLKRTLPMKIKTGCCEMFGWQDNQECIFVLEGTAPREFNWFERLLYD